MSKNYFHYLALCLESIVQATKDDFCHLLYPLTTVILSQWSYGNLSTYACHHSLRRSIQAFVAT